MVKRGQHSRLEQIEDEICSILLRKGSLGFTELQEEQSKSSEERRAGSPTTLSHCLKNLAKAGVVERDIETRKWKLTTLGRLSIKAHEQVDNPDMRKHLRQDALFVLFKEAKPDAWWDLVERVARSLEIEKSVKDLPEEEVLKNLKSYTEQTKHGITAVWSGIMSDMLLDVGVLLAGILLIRSLYPSPLDRVSASKMATTIRGLVTDWGKITTKNIEQMIAANVLNLEVLVALDKAIRDGKLNHRLETLTVDEVTKKLLALGYLKAETPSDRI